MLTFNTVNRQTVIISNSVCVNTSREWGDWRRNSRRKGGWRRRV